MIGIPTSRIVLGIDGSRKKLTRIRRFKPMYEANHDDDPKHPVPRGLLGVLRCYGTLCEEVGSHLVGVDRMQRNFEPMKKQVEAWKGTRLPDETAKLVIYRAFVQGELDVPKHLAKRVHDQYFNPQVEEFAPRTTWSLSNAFTSANS